jgi:periplasmic protein TonB
MIQHPAARLPVIVLAALLVNVLMFTAIEYMIGMRQIRLTDATDFDIANFIRVAEQPRDVSSRRDPKAPEKPQQEMQQDIQRLSQATSTTGAVAFSVEMPDIDIDIGGNIQIARELTPLVRIPADYPVQALIKGIEGFVEVRFTVTETGAVSDPEVLRADPPGVFERAATRAILKWKYQPQLVDGRPTAVISYARLVFVIENRQQ